MNRRNFVSASISTLSLLATAQAWAQPKAIHARKSAADLTEREWQVFERGVLAMKSLPRDVALSWDYQARVHGFVAAQEFSHFPLWGTCQHGNWWFLPWHRGYLYYFEQILRGSCQDSTFALPYWDWTDPNQMTLPDRFLRPGSPLYEVNRSWRANSGGVLPDSAVRWEEAMAQRMFSTPRAGEGFGGQYATELGSTDIHGGAESLMHDSVHDWVGGFMGDPDTAGRDPVFSVLSG